jgi:hypothetical protein
MASDKLERDDGAAATRKHERRLFAGRCQQPVRIVSEDLDDPFVLDWHVERAVR